MTDLILIGLIFLYILFGYIFTTVLLALGDDFCENIAPWVTTNDPGFSQFLGCTLWPFMIFFTVIIAFCKVVSVVGNKLSILPVSIALAIKYMIDKKEVKDDSKS